MVALLFQETFAVAQRLISLLAVYIAGRKIKFGVYVNARRLKIDRADKKRRFMNGSSPALITDVNIRYVSPSFAC